MAEKSEIIAELEALETHCRAPLMSIDSRAIWMRDWCDDLGQFPIEAVRLAFRDWRHGPVNKFPTPGQLLPMVRAKVAQPAAVKEDAWRPLTDGEYFSASIPEKIRHHECSAAAIRPGAQWKNGQPVAADDMPAEWHEKRQRVANHLAQAKRLRKILKGETSDVVEPENSADLSAAGER